MVEPRRGLHIDVGHSIGDGTSLNLEGELRLVKLALLYGDGVTLHSPRSESLRIANEIIKEWRFPVDTNRLRTIMHAEQHSILDELDTVTEEWEAHTEQLKQFERKTSRAQRRNSPNYLRMKRILNMYKARIESQKYQVISLFSHTGIEELIEAVDNGWISLENYENVLSSSVFAQLYTARMLDLVSHGNSYPLFDDQTAEIIRLAAQEGMMQVTDFAVRRSRQVGLSSEFLQRLPTFEQATIREVVDIRRALNNPLVRFRSAMSEYSQVTTTASWDSDFLSEADELFVARVAPAIAEIEEAVKENNIFRALSSNLIQKTASAGFLTIGLMHMESITNILGRRGTELVGGAIGLAAGVLNDYRVESRKIQGNQMYFLYRVNRHLAGSQA